MRRCTVRIARLFPTPYARRVLAALAIGACSSPLTSPTHAADSPYALSPTFVQSQADAGARVYAQRCAGCHGPNLNDGPFAPALAGDSFLQKWSGQRAGALVDYMMSSMPPAAPGSLGREETVQLLALLLQNNHVRPGTEPLPAAPEALAAILLPAPTNAFGEVAAGIVLPPPPDPRANPLDAITPVTEPLLRDPPPGDWLSWRRTRDAGGFSPLSQINRENVAQLRLAWSWALPNGENEVTPLVHDGVMFVYGYDDVIQALDAANGDLLWQYTRRHTRASLYPKWRRAIALYGERVYTLTFDGHVVALDFRTGRTVWDVVLEPATTPFGLSGGPLIADGKVIVGTSGLHPGGNFIIALDAETGREVWRFATIPAPGQPGGDSWNGLPYEKRSGGAVWTPGSHDPELNLVFFGPGNTYDTKPLRDRVPDARYTNDALFTNATLALRADTGELAWYFAHFPNDQWDLDWAFERQILTLPLEGQDRKVVVTAGKIGIHDVLDARTGRYLFSMDPGLQNLVTAIDPRTGVKAIDRDQAPGDGERKFVCPHLEGGKNWTPSSYDPRTRRLYVAMVETCMDIRPGQPGTRGLLSTGAEFGVRPRPGSDGRYGRLEAFDLLTRKSVWVARERPPLVSGVLATAGGLVFAGYLDRTLAAYDDNSGRKLWSARLNEVPNSNAITYMAGGRQYVAIVVGMGGNHSRLFAGLTPEIRNPANRSSSVWVFELPEAGSTSARGR